MPTCRSDELARRNGIRVNAIWLWGSKYAGMSASDLAPLKQLEAKNEQMQRAIARQALRIDVTEGLTRKNSWSLFGEPKAWRPCKTLA